MAENSAIEWCHHTFNPWEGCQKVSPGCDHCYAEARNARFGGGQAVNWGPSAPRRRTSDANWCKPPRWNSRADKFLRQHQCRQRVFCASLADWLDNEVLTTWRCDLLALIQATPNLDWLLLSKRIGTWRARMQEAVDMAAMEPGRRIWPGLAEWTADWLGSKAPANVWIGSTVVNQIEANRDAPKLLDVQARVRFLSVEPMLGPVDLERPRPGPDLDQGGWPICQPWLIQSGIDWVICGGESGPKARPMRAEWARSLRDQCAAAGVAFHFKQWGQWLPAGQDGAHDHEPAEINASNEPVSIGKKAAGRLLDGRTHDDFPVAAR